MANEGVYVEGLRETVRDLEKAGVDLDDLKDAFNAIAKKGTDIAQGVVPQKSGRLRASVRPNRAKNKAVVLAGRASVKYAGVQNYGWATRGITGRHFLQAIDTELGPKTPALIEEALDALFAKYGLE